MTSRRVGTLVGLAGLWAVGTGRLDAHPLHSSFAEVGRDAGGVVSISVRLFADDFGALLESQRSSNGGLSRDAVARAYVQRQLTITGLDGLAIATRWCGMRSDQIVVWVCLRTTQPVAGAFLFRNALMFDRFSDQISIIRWNGKKRGRTLVLSARAPEARLE